MDALVAWCAANLNCYDIRVAILPATGVVRVWVQRDHGGKRRVPIQDIEGNKIVGEAPLQEPVAEALDRAAGALLDALSLSLSQQEREQGWTQFTLILEEMEAK